MRLKTNECSFDLARDFSAMLNVTSMLHTLCFMTDEVGEINVNRSNEVGRCCSQ